jgi:hypothetical protein
MAIYDDKWFEIWYEEGTDIVPHYLLVVATNLENRAEILVYDPLKNNEIVFRSFDYEKIRHWLFEDEFQPAEGRIFPEDPW